MFIAFWMGLCALASATEVVWLGDPPAESDLASLASEAGLQGEPHTLTDLRAAATAVTSADNLAWTALAEALEGARAFEVQLDGELVIMRDLAHPIAQIGVILTSEQRDLLYTALAYRGFAVDRYYGDTLPEDAETAAKFWVTVPDGRAVPTSWADAIALAPDREPTAQEISEAPQRERFRQDIRVLETLLPGAIRLTGDWPEGASLVVDGRPVQPGANRQVRVRPGRHLAHVEIEGQVVARYDFRVEPAGVQEISVALTDADLRAWVGALQQGQLAPAPEALGPSLRAWGDDVVLAWHEKRGMHAVRVSSTGTTALTAASSEGSARDSRIPQFQLGVGVGAGWFESGDFYAQDPAHAPHTVATVNSAVVDIAVDASFAYKLLRVGVVGDIGITPGAYHVAQTGTALMRVRPDLSIAVGVKWAQITGGWLFPYHPSIGARVTIPVWRGLEVLAVGRAGLPVTLQRPDGAAWTGLPVVQAWAGIGWRLGVPLKR